MVFVGFFIAGWAPLLWQPGNNGYAETGTALILVALFVGLPWWITDAVRSRRRRHHVEID